MRATDPATGRCATVALALGVTMLTATGSLAGQVCFGTGLSDGGGAVRAQAARVSGALVAGAAIFVDPLSPLGFMGQVDYATGTSGDGVHLGGRGVYEMGSPLRTMLCLTAGASFYQSEGRQSDHEGTPQTLWYRIYSPTAGLAVGATLSNGPLLINPYGLTEGHFVYKQRRGEGRWFESDEWSGYSNEARAIVEVGVGLQWQRFLFGAALLHFPGTHSILEAFQGTVEAGGSDAGLRLTLGLIF